MTTIEIQSEHAALLDLGWLAVEGERPLPLCGGHSYYDTDACYDCDVAAESKPVAPADLLALAGKACETCGGSGETYQRCKAPACDGGHVCGLCHGTGSELLTVTWACDACGGRGVHGGEHDGATAWYCQSCWTSDFQPGDGTRSTLVRLTGQPVPVVDGSKPEGYDPSGRNYGRMITVDSDGLCRIGDDWDGWTVADLGPNPESLIGMWLFPVEVVT